MPRAAGEPWSVPGARSGGRHPGSRRASAAPATVRPASHAAQATRTADATITACAPRAAAMRPVHHVPATVRATPASRHSRPDVVPRSHESGSEPSIMPKPIPTSGSTASIRAVARGPASCASRLHADVLRGAGRRREAAPPRARARPRCRRRPASRRRAAAARRACVRRRASAATTSPSSAPARRRSARPRRPAGWVTAALTSGNACGRLTGLELGGQRGERLDHAHALARASSPRRRTEADPSDDATARCRRRSVMAPSIHPCAARTSRGPDSDHGRSQPDGRGHE